MASAIDEYITALRHTILVKARHFTAYPEVGKALGYTPSETPRLEPEGDDNRTSSGVLPRIREINWIRCVAELDVPLSYHWHVEEGLAGFYDLVIVPIKAVRFEN